MFERNRRNSARRQLFLLDNRLIITKEKDADGLFVFKDSLKVHSLSVAEKEGDSPNRFAVGTGTVGAWDQYYLFEAASAEKKQEWLQALKDIMKGQYDLLQGMEGEGGWERRKGDFLGESVKRENAVRLVCYNAVFLQLSPLLVLADRGAKLSMHPQLLRCKSHCTITILSILSFFLTLLSCPPSISLPFLIFPLLTNAVQQTTMWP